MKYIAATLLFVVLPSTAAFFAGYAVWATVTYTLQNKVYALQADNAENKNWETMADWYEKDRDRLQKELDELRKFYQKSDAHRFPLNWTFRNKKTTSI